MKKRRIGIVLLLVAFILCYAGETWALKAEEVAFLSGTTYYEKVHKAINEAKDSIYISMYLFKKYGEDPRHEVNALLNDLIKAKKRGVEIKVLLDQTMKDADGASSNKETYQVLLENKIETEFAPEDRVFHAKLVIIDEHIIFVGSHNWSRAALGGYNNEYSVMVKSREVAREFLKDIDSLGIVKTKIAPEKPIPKEVKRIEPAKAYLQMAENYYQNRMYEKALEEYQKIITEFPESKEATIARERIREIKAR